MINIFKLTQVLFCFILLTSCVYTRDKLKIKNNSKEEIVIKILTKNNTNNTYYGISGNCSVGVNKTESPIVRSSIESSIESENSDHYLYIVFCRPKDIHYVNANEDNLIQNKRFQHLKLNKKQLDSLNWFIEYNNNKSLP